ncbi:MAG: 4Fe-4S dicluster domain-containing protein [Deltaproteobacteria bacterium]|nr:4Fe-4S dicluster domain-containing protein [Deltaproteobacteria bacterium]
MVEWNEEAEKALSRVPFFVRKRVKKRVEEDARLKGAGMVHMGHMDVCRKRFLTKMEQEVKGYGIETCFGAGGCPNRACHTDDLSEKIETVLEGKDLKGFLKRKVKGPLKMHHEFRVSVSDCPNGCSRPQISDFGLMGAERPKVSKEPCSSCGACEAICKEKAIVLQGETVRIDQSRCLACGQCIDVCPTETLVSAEKGYRILLGGKLGRHPRLAEALPSIYSPLEVLDMLNHCLDHYRRFSIYGERFGEILERVPFEKD